MIDPLHIRKRGAGRHQEAMAFCGTYLPVSGSLPWLSRAVAAACLDRRSLDATSLDYRARLCRECLAAWTAELLVTLRSVGKPIGEDR